MTEWYAGHMAEDPFKTVVLTIMIVAFFIQIAWPHVRDLFDPVVKREYGHVVAVDIAVDGGAWWKGNEDPMQARMVAQMPSGEELLFGWQDGTVGLPRAITRQVFARGGWLINQDAPKINAEPDVQKAAIAHMKERYFRYLLPEPMPVVIVHRKSGRFSGVL